MLDYQQEFVCSIKSEIQDLLRDDWREIEHCKEVRTLNPDWDAYDTLEQANMLKVFTVRASNKIVGYYAAIISPSLHSKGLLQAAADVVYLHPDHRKGLTGYKLFKFAERCLREDGIKVLHLTTTEANPIDAIMQKLGYNKIETKFEKVL